MNKELRELLAKINAKKQEGLALANDKKLDEAEKISNEVVDLEREFAIKSKLFVETVDNTSLTQFDNKDGDKKENKAELYKNAFYNALGGKKLTQEEDSILTEVNNALSSTSGTDGGYLIPIDQQTAIKELKRELLSLETLVNVETVTTLTGSRNIEKDADYVAFAEFTEGNDVVDTDTPQFTNVAYTIKDRGGILPIPNNLLADNQANLQAYLNRWLAKKSVATRNKLIADILATLAKTAITGIDDVKTALNVTLDPAISAMAMIVTNQDGFNKFDKMKDAEGNYLLQKNPLDPTQKLLAGKVVKVYSNKTIKTVAGKAPVIIGSLKECVTLFDREQMSLLATNVGGTAFVKNRTDVRAIEREDVQKVDTAAVVYGEIALA